MSTSRSIVLLCVLAWSCALRAQEAGDSIDGDVQKQIEQLLEQQNSLADRYNTLLREIKKNDQLSALNKTIAGARAKLAQAEANNDSLTTARQNEQDVREAVKLAIEKKLREHGEGGQLLERITELKSRRADHQWQIVLAEFQLNHELSPVNRALAGDEELTAAKAKLDAAGIEDRTEAKSAYDQLRARQLDDIVEAQRLLAVIEDSTAAAQRMLESIVAVEERLAPIRKQIERVENKRIAEARSQVADALNNDAIVELRQEVNDVVTEYNELIKKLVAENEEAVRLKAEYDEVRAKITELRNPVE